MSNQQTTLAMVTGAAGGIGAATTRRLIANGMRVIALDRSEDGLAALAEDVKNEALATCKFHLVRVGNIPKLAQDLVEQHGPITRLVNNAGVWEGGPIVDMTDEVWNFNFTINVTAPFVFMRELAPVMAEAGGGCIVNISSRNALRSSTNNAAYDASKAALVALTRTAAGEFAKYNIRVNALCPGVISTPSTSEIEEELFKAAYTRLIPLRRYGRPDEMANIIAFLLSDEASFMTGETIVADGGQIACQDNDLFMEIPGLKE